MNTIESAIEEIRRGGLVAVVDDEDRENEGDLIVAAEAITTEKVAFLLRRTSGVICIAITPERARKLNLSLMVATNTESMRTAFTVSVDLRGVTTTGISANDRAATLKAIADDRTVADDLLRPGHVFPLVARAGGVLRRAGHTEAAVDLCELAGLSPVGVLSEIVSEDHSRMASREEIETFTKKYGIPLISIADLIRYRRRTEKLVEHVSTARMPTGWGYMTVHAYQGLDNAEHLALVKGDPCGGDPLIRVHSECLTGDVFRSFRCDCGEQLDLAMRQIMLSETGIVVYLRGHEGRGVGLCNKIRAYALQDQGQDTVDANLSLGLPIDSREYGVGAQILSQLGVTRLRLLTNNPGKYGGLEGYGLTITERVPLVVPSRPENEHYVQTKALRLGHLLKAG